MANDRQPHWSMIVDDESLLRSLTNFRPPAGTVFAMKALRRIAFQLGQFILERVPASRYRSLAISSLEETVMWAMKAMALDPETAGDPDELFDESEIESFKRLKEGAK